MNEPELSNHNYGKNKMMTEQEYINLRALERLRACNAVIVGVLDTDGETTIADIRMLIGRGINKFNVLHQSDIQGRSEK